jgi:[ribosomal protein S5]-alanine N-acetyltransferase
MPDDPVRLRPIEEADLNLLRRLDTDPAASQQFEWTGFRDPGARRRRWEQDGWISRNSSHLAVALPDGTLVGIVSWRAIKERIGFRREGVMRGLAFIWPR